ncbi:hypothetical protein CT19425_U610016 [Cupriavidus taiwanensis]|uniref:Uncharacterized protein n=1 Tax=Cupriavidus taiwanensis TaxID=164546 RepID=A0A375I951_9BURK|nr:hypothetical protein CT19425_U610016 [Cupriavidus taiwanensis]
MPNNTHQKFNWNLTLKKDCHIDGNGPS